MRQILGQNYQAGSSEAELRLYPELPLTSEITLDAARQSPEKQVSTIRPPSHRGVTNLPKLIALKEVNKVNLTYSNVAKLRAKDGGISDIYNDNENRFVNSFLNSIKKR